MNCFRPYRRRINNTISRIAERLGYTIIPTWRLEKLAVATQLRNSLMASRLRNVFSAYRIEAVIDVGANEGQYRDFLRDEVGFDGRIDSFEPLPDLAQHLIRRAASEDSKWTIHACALGAEAGALNINAMKWSQLNSFRQPLRTENAFLNRENVVIKTMSVPVSTLDSEFSGTNLHRTYLKLDTQGFDLEILQGGMRAIVHIPALQTEVSFQPLYEEMPDYRSSIKAFENCGFCVADFFLVGEDDACRAMEFDCLMVRPLAKGPHV